VKDNYFRDFIFFVQFVVMWKIFFNFLSVPLWAWALAMEKTFFLRGCEGGSGNFSKIKQWNHQIGKRMEVHYMIKGVIIKLFQTNNMLPIRYSRAMDVKEQCIVSSITNPSRKLGFCHQSICDYLPLFVICDYHWLFIQLFFAFGCACNYNAINLQLMFFFILPFEQLLTCFS